MSHTPGPWHVSDEGGAKLEIHSEIGTVATVHGGGNRDDETLPNARLLAAAPDLLAVLEALASVAVWDDDYTTREEFEPISAKVDAAIKKARGER